MRLRRLDLTRYGKFTGQGIDFGPAPADGPDMHIVFGLNEAGKSTALSAWLDLLFGIEERSRYNFLHPYPTMEIGGTLEFDGALHELSRVKQRAPSLRDSAGRAVSDALLSTPLAGLTRETYRTMFSLDDQTIEDGGEAILHSRGDLGALLFSASAGLGDLSQRLDDIGKAADAIYRKRAQKTEIAELKRDISSLKAQRDEIDIQASAHAALQAARAAAQTAHRQASDDRAAAKVRAERLRALERARPCAAAIRRIDGALAELGDLARPPLHWAGDLDGLAADEGRLTAALAGLDSHVARIEQEITEIPQDARALGLGDLLTGLADGAARFRTAEADLPKRRSERLAADARITALLPLLGCDAGTDPQQLLVSAPVAGMLRDLIEQRSGIAARFEATLEELTAAQAAVQAAAETPGAAPVDATGVAALRLALKQTRDGDLTARIGIAENALPAKRNLAARAMAGLAPWNGTPDELAQVAVPDAARLVQWREASAKLDQREETLRARLEDLETQRVGEAARQAAGADAVADDSAAAALRGERDAAWQTHLTALDAATAAEFERLLARHDSVSEQRLSRAGELADLRAQTAAMVVAKAQADELRNRLAQLETDRERLRNTVAQAAPHVPAPADAPLGVILAGIDTWVAARSHAFESTLAVRDAEDELTRLTAQAEAMRGALATGLSNLGYPAGDSPQAVLAEMADTVLSDLAVRQTAQVTAQRALEVRQRAAEQAQTAETRWQAEWTQTLGETWFSDRTNPGAVRELLDRLAGLPGELEARRELDHRIDTMEANRAGFAAEVSGLAAALGVADGDTLSLAQTLSTRHGGALAADQRLTDRRADLAKLTADRDAQSDRLTELSARLKPMLAFFGLDDLPALQAAMGQCAARDDLERERQGLASRILGELGDDDLPTALARIDSLDADTAAQDLAGLEQRLGELDDLVSESFADLRAAEQRLNAVGGDDSVARIDAARRTALLSIEDAAQRFLRLRAGGMVAAQALRAYRDRHRSSMMTRASDAFAQITGGAYCGLTTRADGDSEILIGQGRDGGSKLAEDMSKGTRFQLYLALRLAGYAEFAAVRPTVPFIADDIMETFDEPRSHEVFRLFGDMAGLGQVIYLTHHRHLCDIARAVVPGVRVHELPS